MPLLVFRSVNLRHIIMKISDQCHRRYLVLLVAVDCRAAHHAAHYSAACSTNYVT